MAEEKQILCTLSRAVDLIAFGALDMSERHCFANQAEQEKAAESLKSSIVRRVIHVFEPSVYGNGWKEIKNLDNSMIMDINRSSIGCNNEMHLNVGVLYDEVIKCYPSIVNSDSGLNSYTTPYLDIIKEVIQQEHINNENQSKATSLASTFHNKLKLYGLPDSDKLATAMATIVRLPESQNRHKKKG